MAFPEASMSETSLALSDQSPRKRYAGDDRLLVKFYNKPVQNAKKSETAGRPIFDELEYVHIMQPGNKDSIVDRPARKRDQDRFPEHYKRFKARVSQEIIEGTPLAAWPVITRSQVEELKFYNVHTVEQLANISDSNTQNFMGINTLKTKAAAFLAAAGDNAASEAVAAELTDLRNKNETLETALADLQAQVAKLTKE